MKIIFLTIFPDILNSYISESIMKRAIISGIVDFEFKNIRDFSKNKHKNVDDVPYGGGVGMLMQIEPIHRCIKDTLKKSSISSDKRRIILLSAKGSRYTQEDAYRFKDYEELIFICGRYEGVDERVAEYIADEELSIGDYVLTGGELPAMVIADSVVRLLPGVLGNKDSIKQESYSELNYKEYPQYTRPAEYNTWKVPEELLSGNHKLISEWKSKNSIFTNNGNNKKEK